MFGIDKKLKIQVYYRHGKTELLVPEFVGTDLLQKAFDASSWNVPYSGNDSQGFRFRAEIGFEALVVMAEQGKAPAGAVTVQIAYDRHVVDIHMEPRRAKHLCDWAAEPHQKREVVQQAYDANGRRFRVHVGSDALYVKVLPVSNESVDNTLSTPPVTRTK